MAPSASRGAPAGLRRVVRGRLLGGRPRRPRPRPSSDRSAAGRELPVALVIACTTAAAVVVTARILDLPGRPTIVLALLPLVGLGGLTALMLRGNRRLLDAIEVREQQLTTVLDGLPIAAMVRAPDGTLVHCNAGTEAFVERLGVDLQAIRGSASELMAHVEVVDVHERPYERERLPVVSAVRDGGTHDAIVGHGLPAGGYAWYSVRAAPLPLTDGSLGTIVTLDDVTEQQEARLRITLAERSARLTFEHAPIGVAVIGPDGVLLRSNAALHDLLGHADHEQLAAAGIGTVILTDALVDPTSERRTGLLSSAERVRVERDLPHADGHLLPTELSIALVRDDQDRPLHLIVQVVDLSARRALEAELRAAASHDPLTGLVNRRALADRLRAAQARRDRDGRDLALLFIDLDRFKAVNDEHGHETGDRLLVEVARGLVDATRRSDTVCRLGGDEFVVLCHPIDGEGGLRDVVDRLQAVRPLVEVAGSTVEVGSSIGAVLVDPDEDLDTALRRAVAAMYRRKRTATVPTSGASADARTPS